MFITEKNPHKCQGMSKHLKDPKNTFDTRGLNHKLMLSTQVKIFNSISV